MNKKRCVDRKKVCIIRSNPVRPDSRVEKEAWTLMKAGYDVHILAWDRDTEISEIEDYIWVADVRIPITRLGYKATYGEGFKNIKAYVGFQIHMRKWLKKRNFDAVHACDFDTAFFSQGIVIRKGKKFVFDIFDFLYGDPQNIMQYCVKKAQINIINNADATIICTEERINQIKGSTPKILTVIHNTPALEQARNVDIVFKDSNRIKVVYVGILQEHRLLKEIAEVITKSEKMELHIGGFGKYSTYFSDLAQRFDNIIFYGRLSYEQTLELEKKCDVMLAIYEPSIENHKFAAPNKFYESLIMGKPVVMVKKTGMSQIVEEQDIGVLIDYSKEGFQKGMEQLIGRRSEWEMMGSKMRKLYLEKYCWNEMQQRLLGMYKKLLGGGS